MHLIHLHLSLIFLLRNSYVFCVENLHRNRTSNINQFSSFLFVKILSNKCSLFTMPSAYLGEQSMPSAAIRRRNFPIGVLLLFRSRLRTSFDLGNSSGEPSASLKKLFYIQQTYKMGTTNAFYGITNKIREAKVNK